MSSNIDYKGYSSLIHFADILLREATDIYKDSLQPQDLASLTKRIEQCRESLKGLGEHIDEAARVGVAQKSDTELGTLGLASFLRFVGQFRKMVISEMHPLKLAEKNIQKYQQ